MIPHKLAHILHPLILKILSEMQEHTFHFLNEHPHIQGNVIYAVNHGCKFDTPYCGLIIKEQVWLVAGKQRLTLADRAFFNLNGCIWVDRKDKDSKTEGAKRMLELLMRGENVLMFPEGTWNTIPSLPMMPMPWGIIDLAMKSGRPIVPIALEYFDKECYVKYGEAFYCNEQDDKLDRICKLRDTMATLRWDIWESQPLYHRSIISDDEWEKEVMARVEAYPQLDFAYEQSCIRKEKGVITPEEAFGYWDKLIPCRENAFLLKEKYKETRYDTTETFRLIHMNGINNMDEIINPRRGKDENCT